MPDGMVKLIAKEKAEKFDKTIIAAIVKTYFLMIIPVIITAVTLSLIFADQVTLFVFGDIQYKNYFLIGLIGLPVSFIASSFRSILKAFKEIRSFATAEIYSLIINFLLFFPLVYFFGVLGGVISVALYFVVGLLVVFSLVRKNVFKKYGITFKLIREAVFSKIHYKELLTFIGIGFVAGTFKVFENMASRAIVVNNLGIDHIGIYSPITKWQVLFIGFILPSIFTYLYPRLSESKTNEEIISVVNDVIRMITFLVLPFIIIGISTRQWIIPLFYSKEFLEASIYLPYHFAFLLFMVWGIILMHLFAPTGRVKLELVFHVVINALSLLMVYYFVPKIGLYGYLLKFTVTPLVQLIAFFIFWKKEISFSLKRENIFISFYAVFCCALMLIIKDLHPIFQVSIAIVLISFMAFFMKKQERNFLLRKLKLIK